MPSKSATAWLKLLFASANAAASTVGSLAKTVLISPLTFSSSMFAMEAAPTLQPARDHSPQRARAFFAPGRIIEHDRPGVPLRCAFLHRHAGPNRCTDQTARRVY